MVTTGLLQCAVHILLRSIRHSFNTDNFFAYPNNAQRGWTDNGWVYSYHLLLTIDETHWLQGAIYIGGMISMMWDPRFYNMFWLKIFFWNRFYGISTLQVRITRLKKTKYTHMVLLIIKAYFYMYSYPNDSIKVKSMVSRHYITLLIWLKHKITIGGHLVVSLILSCGILSDLILQGPRLCPHSDRLVISNDWIIAILTSVVLYMGYFYLVGNLDPTPTAELTLCGCRYQVSPSLKISKRAIGTLSRNLPLHFN